MTANIRELKKLDDKQMLTETHLTESRIYHSLQNIPKGEYVRSFHQTQCVYLHLSGDRQASAYFSIFNDRFKVHEHSPFRALNFCMSFSLSLSLSLPLFPSDIFFLSFFLCVTFTLYRLAKASLTASRSAANAIYVMPLLQVGNDSTNKILLQTIFPR